MENEKQQKIESFLKSSQIDVLKEEEQVMVLGGSTRMSRTSNSGTCTHTKNSNCENSRDCQHSENDECANTGNCSEASSGGGSSSGGGTDRGCN